MAGIVGGPRARADGWIRSLWAEPGRRYRQAVAVSALLSVGLISLRLLTDVTVALWRVGPWQLPLYLLGMLLAGRAAWRRPGWTFACTGAALLALAPFSLLLRIYGFVDLNSLRYHIQAGITADSVGVALRPAIVVMTATTFLLLCTAHLGGLLGWRRTVAGAVALVALALNPVLGALVSYATVNISPANLADRITPPRLEPTPLRPDIVIIYLEGLELGYADRTLFGDSYDPIRQLWPEALALTGIAQVEGTGWSAAGMMSTQCGLPILPNGVSFQNGLIGQEEFLTGHPCLGDLLAELGYQSHFVVGGDAIFGGIGAFYEDHGIPDQTDLDDLAAAYPTAEVEAARADWVLDDQMVFERAKDLVRVGLGSEGPQALIIETFGPHGPEHLLSRRCSSSGRAELVDDMRPAVRCLAEQALEFVRVVQTEAGDRPTVIVLLSDHLGHDYRLQTLLADQPRRNTVLLMGAGRAGERIERPASMIDVFPTLLAYAGLARPDVRGGLGVSLFSESPTLVEELGLDGLNAQLRFDGRIRQAIWAPPSGGQSQQDRR